MRVMEEPYYKRIPGCFSINTTSQENLEPTDKLPDCPDKKAKSGIEELAERRVHLESRIEALEVSAFYSRTLEHRIDCEISRIKSARELNQVKQQIKDYEDGK